MKKKINLLLIILWMILIFVMSSFNANDSANQSNIIVHFISYVFNINNLELLSFIVRKLAHFSEYFLLGLLVTIDFNVITKSTKYLTVMLSCFLTGIFTALIDESIQTFTPGRAGMVMDVWLDFSGFLFAFSFMTIYIKSHYMVK